MALSNTAVPKYYGMFRDAVIRGEIPVCKEISMEMNRVDDLIANPGIYYDDQAVEGWIAYCESELTLTDGSDLNLLDSFKLWGEQVYGWYYFVERSVWEPSSDGHGGRYVNKRIKQRLIKKQYLIVGRGAAKSLYDTCIQSYGLNIDPSVYNRIALDCASISIQHVRLDDSERFLEKISSGLNDCLNLSANIDQTGRAFLQDIVLSMLDEGCVAIVPVDTDDDPDITGSYKIESMRTGKIMEWFPSHVKVRVYNERTGLKEDIVVPKDTIAIIENPLYAVINEPNSTMQRLIRKLNLLDVVDEQSSSGKLDLIIQLPYVIKTEARRQQAEKRRVEIERQLAGSKYGIAYTDGTERITQLNRSVENNLMKQIEYLTSMLYSQLGITQSILDGSADEKTMLNYYNRTIEPIIAAIVDELKRKFLTKTARSQKQSILFFRDPFKLVPVADLSEIADKFTRNEIMTSNEIRQIIGMKPSDDPKADELKNSNISEAKSEPSNGSYDVEPNESDAGADYDSIVNELLDGLEKEIDEIIGSYVSDDEEEP